MVSQGSDEETRVHQLSVDDLRVWHGLTGFRLDVCCDIVWLSIVVWLVLAVFHELSRGNSESARIVRRYRRGKRVWLADFLGKVRKYYRFVRAR